MIMMTVLFVLGYIGMMYIMYLGFIFAGIASDNMDEDSILLTFLSCLLWPASIPLFFMGLSAIKISQMLSGFHKKIYNIGKRYRSS